MLTDSNTWESRLALAREMTARFPHDGFGWKVMGVALSQTGKVADGLEAMKKAVALAPIDPEAYNNLGSAQLALGHFDDAVKSYCRALELKTDYTKAHNNLGIVLERLGQFDDAVRSYRRALEIEPDFAEAHNNLGTVLYRLGQFYDAARSYRRAVELRPDYTKAHNNLGVVLAKLGQFDDAVKSYSRALEIEPDFAEAHNNLGSVLQKLFRFDDAVRSCRRALELKPDYTKAHSDLLFLLSHDERVDAKALFAEHRCFSEQHEAPLRVNWQEHSNARIPDRCLQVGFVSADLYNHVTAFFIEPLFADLAGSSRLSLHVYCNNVLEDSVSQRLRGYIATWHRVADLTDLALAQKIQEDGIDILIDLSGHTAGNRLLCFARKPAPVQVSWIGYPGTTGLKSMDYYLSDRFFLPPGQLDDQFTEKLVYLPGWAPFLPYSGSPPVNILPALSNGYVTFGSFSRPNKLSPSVIALWSQLLHALPDARMVLGSMPQPGENEQLAAWFAREGISPERLLFYPYCPIHEYLVMHHQIDICLDPFPFIGCTTTCHALWMGVPTLTLAGRTAFGRIGAAVLSHVGLESFIALNISEYVKKGVKWSENLAELAAIRQGLRTRLQHSILCRPHVISACFEQALRTMWQRWCAGLPTESFEVTLCAPEQNK